MRIYAGSNGEFYTDPEVGYQFETDTWHACMWDDADDWVLVETPDNHLLWLVPIDETDLPEGYEVQSTDGGTTVVETRDA